MMPSIPLSELPLRPSTLQLFLKRGFETTVDVDEARKHQPGGMSNLAAELGCDLAQAAGMVREMDGCLEAAWSGGISDDRRCLDPSSSSYQDSIGDGHHDGHSFHSPTSVLTAADLLSTRHHPLGSSGGIVTFSKEVDELLGGGIRLGEVTEVAGLPGCGKTQLAMQLSVLARLPHSFGGVQGRALYIDAEGSFAPERAHDMAVALQNHVSSRRRKSRKWDDDAKKRKNDEAQTAARERDSRGFTVQEILRSIQVFRVHDETALTATLYSLPQYMEETTTGADDEPLDRDKDDDSLPSSLPVRLIVIDSIAFHFRAVAPTDPSYYIQRTKTLTNLASFLGDLAANYNVAVVAINQMTTKIASLSSSSNNGDGNTALVPALGESWAHATATRLLLSYANPYVADFVVDESNIHGHQSQQQKYQHRTCELIKSSYRPSGTAKFIIVQEGIRGMDYFTKGTAARSPPPQNRDLNKPTVRPTMNEQENGANGSKSKRGRLG